MSILNFLAFAFTLLMGLGFISQALVLETTTTAMHQIYQSVIYGSGGIILAISALIFVIAAAKPHFMRQ
jgi:hypothetical protein